MSNAIVDPRDPDYCETCGGECVAGCADTLDVDVSCDGRRGCAEPISRVDRRGFAYCAAHGAGFGRKLTKAEQATLRRGETIRY